MKHSTSILTAMLLFGCADSGGFLQTSENPKTESTPPTTSETEGSEDLSIDEPVLVGGTFLYATLDCALRNVPVAGPEMQPFSCRLLDNTGKKYVFPPDFAIKLTAFDEDGDNANATFTADDPTSEWHYSGLMEGDDADDSFVRGDIVYQGRDYVTNLADLDDFPPSVNLLGANRIYGVGDGNFNCDAGMQDPGEVIDEPSDENPTVYLVLEFQVPDDGADISFLMKNFCDSSADAYVFIRSLGTTTTRATPSIPVPKTDGSTWTPEFQFFDDVELEEGRYQFVIESTRDVSSYENFFFDDVEISATQEILLITHDFKASATLPGIALDQPYVPGNGE